MGSGTGERQEEYEEEEMAGRDYRGTWPAGSVQRGLAILGV